MARAADGSRDISGDEVAGLLMKGDALALEQATIDTAAEGLTSLARGISLCQTGMFGKELHIEADMLAGQGVQMERACPDSFTTSTVGKFRCAVSFVDVASSATLLSPGNEIAHDNTGPACGPGKFSLIE